MKIECTVEELKELLSIKKDAPELTEAQLEQISNYFGKNYWLFNTVSKITLIIISSCSCNFFKKSASLGSLEHSLWNLEIVLLIISSLDNNNTSLSR